MLMETICLKTSKDVLAVAISSFIFLIWMLDFVWYTEQKVFAHHSLNNVVNIR